MKTRLAAQGAFSLVEVALAMAVASFCLIALIGLLTVGLAAQKASTNETEALHLMNQVTDDLQVAVATGAKNSPFYGILMPVAGSANTMAPGSQPIITYMTADGSTTLQSGSAVTSKTPGAFRVTIGFNPSSQTSGVSVGATARIMISWPAAADGTSGWPGSQNAFIGRSIESVFVLNSSTITPSN